MEIKIPFISEDQLFVHFTYAWKLEAIKEKGLQISVDGTIGPGLYACRIDDKTCIKNAITFMKDEVNWGFVTEYYGFESVDDLPDYVELKELIFPVVFRYSGRYFLSNHKVDWIGLEREGYIMIPQLVVDKDKLQFGDSLDEIPDVMKWLSEVSF